MNKKRDIETVWLNPPLFRQSFEECRKCFEDVIGRARKVIVSPKNIPPEFAVTLGDFPQEFYSIRRHLFSLLFQSMYALLGLPPAKRLLYGKLNYLFRIWVTSADNLLDNEDKVTLPIRMKGQGHIMTQVVAIMAADRITASILNEAVQAKVLSFSEAERLSGVTLQVLLPSAAQEASEEGGISVRLSPKEMIEKVHVLKTGILFNLPFLGPRSMETDIDMAVLRALEKGLMDFGIGCQVLDDIRDLAIDFKERRQNYILSQIAFQDPVFFSYRVKDFSDNIDLFYKDPALFNQYIVPAAQLGDDYLRKGLSRLNEHGMGLKDRDMEEIAQGMFQVLALGEAHQWLNQCPVKNRS